MHQLGDVRTDRVAVHRSQRQAQAERPQQLGRLHAGAQHDGVKALRRIVICYVKRSCLRFIYVRYRRVECKTRAQLLGRVAQDDGKLAAVTDLVLRQVDGASQRRVRVQRRFELARLVGADFMKRHAQLAQQRQARLHQVLVLGAAQQHHVAGGAVEVVGHARGHLVQAVAAVEGQTLHARAVGGVAGRLAGGVPAAHPGHVGRRQRPAHAHRGVARQQVAQYLDRHAGRGPRRDVAGRHHASVGEAGALGHAGMALEHRHLMAVGGQFVGRGHADDAGAQDGDVHKKEVENGPGADSTGASSYGFWSAGCPLRAAPPAAAHQGIPECYNPVVLRCAAGSSLGRARNKSQTSPNEVLPRSVRPFGDERAGFKTPTLKRYLPCP